MQEFLCVFDGVRRRRRTTRPGGVAASKRECVALFGCVCTNKLTESVSSTEYSVSFHRTLSEKSCHNANYWCNKTDFHQTFMKSLRPIRKRDREAMISEDVMPHQRPWLNGYLLLFRYRFVCPFNEQLIDRLCSFAFAQQHFFSLLAKKTVVPGYPRGGHGHST